MAGRIRLGELLVRAGVIDEIELQAALEQQQQYGGRLGMVLVDMNYVSEDVLVRALSKQLGIPEADFEGANVPPEILIQIGPDFAEQNDVCPVRYDPDRRILTVATSDPTNVSAFDEIRFRTGLRIKSTLATPTELARELGRIMGGGQAPFGPDLPETIALDDMADLRLEQDDAGASASVAASGVRVEAEASGLQSDPETTEGASPEAAESVHRLDAAQRQQQRAIRVLVDLLVEKGVFSREDYLLRMTGQ